MARLEELTPGTQVTGIIPNAAVSVIDAKWHGSDVVELTYKTSSGGVDHELLYRYREAELAVLTEGLPWSFDADGRLFKLVSEARRISLAYLFDPHLAVHTSLVEPLPHQITAVYEEMLPRQPLKFLLADDPGSGKTIMAGLLIKELLIRGDLRRCMIVCPGSLAEQWQDELYQKFQLPFEILTNDKLESSRTGNWFQENDLIICRLDKLARSEEIIHPKLRQTDWDLIVCDEAHKMSATYFGNEAKYTKRYRLGQLLSEITRNFLLMTATPHNGKEQDFQLFMALLDADRFEGKFREGVHATDPSDMMRRLVKEELLKFDGKPLFPERKAYTVNYELSDTESRLYTEVTKYVRTEFNRAEALQNDGRRGTIGFALTILQRRLASSPKAIAESLRRRRERLGERLNEARIANRSGTDPVDFLQGLPELASDEAIEDFEDAPSEELEEAEAQFVDQATAAQTIEELKAEIETLKGLEKIALHVLDARTDRKWEELSRIIQDSPLLRDVHGNRRKIIIFTEHRDTLDYLVERISSLLGTPDAVVTIHGGMLRDKRRQAESAFKQDAEVVVLVATDAAGEGINLQRAHLMVNYDLPWNPNRLEQRFGRIHRIGQTEVCHLWNLVATETREGDVFRRLLEKLDTERAALGGRVFDVLGTVFQGTELRELLLEAIRYGDDPEVRARLFQVVDDKLDTEHLKDLLEESALVTDSMDTSRVQRIRQDMERAAVRRLQPHFIAAFFREAFERLGGKLSERETGRYQIRRVPSVIRNRDRAIGTREPVLKDYERITFEKDLIHVLGKPIADFVCPGNPLFEATVDLILERNRDLLKRGATLVDPNDPGDTPRVLFYLQHSIQDARTEEGKRRIVSRQLQFVTIDAEGNATKAGHAPYLDYEPLAPSDLELVGPLLEEDWLSKDLEQTATAYAIGSLVEEHLLNVRGRKEKLIEKTKAAVHSRLTKEISYWDNRYQVLKEKEDAGKTPRLNSAKAAERRDRLQSRLDSRLQELDEEKRLSPLPPVVLGGSLIIPAGLLAKLRGEDIETTPNFPRNTKETELRAMQAVMEAETALGNTPSDVSADNCGYDVWSKPPTDEPLRFLEVKGRVLGGDKVIITRNEILCGLNEPEKFILALVKVDGEETEVRYLRKPFEDPDFKIPAEKSFGASAVVFDLEKLWSKGAPPS